MNTGKEKDYSDDEDNELLVACEHRRQNPETIITPNKVITPTIRTMPVMRETKFSPNKPLVNVKIPEKVDYKKYMIDSVVNTGNVELIMQMFNKL